MLRKVILPSLIIFCVLGSIYTGIAAVSEAAAIGAAGVIVAAAINRTLTWRLLRESMLQTMLTCGLLLWLASAPTRWSASTTMLGGIAFMKSLMTGLPLDPLGIILLMMLIFLSSACFMDWFSIMLLTMPVFLPVVITLGYDPIWFGVLFNMNMQVGYLTPPFGQAAFYLKSVTPPDISLNTIFAALVPFIGLQLIGLALVLFFPQIAIWLPAALR